MEKNPLDAARALFGANLEELAGAVVSGEIPLTTAFINRMVAEKLAGKQLPVQSVRLEAHDAETFTVHVALRSPFPALTVPARIVHQPQLPHDPRLGVQWTLKGLGPFGMLATPVLSYLKALPPGVSADGDRLTVDIHAVMRDNGLGDAVPLLTGLRVLTRGGRVVVQFEVRR